MAITYVNDLRLSEMATGDNSGTWGNVTNTNLELIGDAFGHGTRAIANASTDNITIADGTADADRAMYLKLTGGGQACEITLLPNTVSKVWMMENGTAAALTFTQGSGASVIIPAGDTKIIASDGGGSGAIVYDVFASLSVVDLKVQDDLTVTGLATIGETLAVTGVLTTTAATVFNGGFASNADSTMGTDKKLIFRDAAIHISSTADGDMSIAADDEIDITSTLIDINGAVDMSSTLGVTGVVTANAGVVVDNFTLDGTTLALSSGNFTLDVAGDIILDAAGTEVQLFKSGTKFGKFTTNSTPLGFYIDAEISDGDMFFRGNDGGAQITALTLDMSEAGTATFNHDVKLPSGGNLFFTSGSSFSPRLSNSNSDTALSFFTNNTERFQIATDGGLHVLTPGTSNVRLGVNAGDAITANTNYNVLIGDEAGTAINGGDQNVAVGYQALASENAASNHVAVGYRALMDMDGGNANCAVGASALENLTNASRVTAVGNAAGYHSLGADDATYIGNEAGHYATTSAFSTFVGSRAGQGIDGAKLTGNDNTVIGASAGLIMQGAASLNTFVGKNAGAGATDVSNNTAVGAFAFDAGTGINNTALGSGALGHASNSGAENVAVGLNAGNGLTSGADNTFIGTGAGLQATICDNSVLIGEQAGAGAILTGDNNTMVGRASGYAVTSGVNNLFLGNNAGRATSPGGNITTGSDTITLGDNSIATANIKVDWTVSSDQRDKTDFTALDIGLDFVKALNPVTYKWDQRSDYGDQDADDWSLSDQTPDGTHKKDWLDVGFKAQEVEALEQAAGYNKSNKTNLTVSLSSDGEQYGMKYSKFVPILVKAIQEQNALIEALTARITALEG